MSVVADPIDESVVAPAQDVTQTRIWGTKGIAFWALLSAVLIKARPNSLLELGSGRSTTFLADYAFRERVRFTSIEQSEVWHSKVAADIAFMGISRSYVHHAPLVAEPDEPTWYDHEKVGALLGERAFDLVFLDGPTGASRKNRAGQALVFKAARDARLIFVDDVHRRHNDSFFRKLSKRFPRDGVFYHRYGRNLIAIAADEWAPLVRSTFEFLELEYTHVKPEEEPRDDQDRTG